jgi:hypothetical protein
VGVEEQSALRAGKKRALRPLGGRRRAVRPPGGRPPSSRLRRRGHHRAYRSCDERGRAVRPLPRGRKSRPPSGRTRKDSPPSGRASSNGPPSATGSPPGVPLVRRAWKSGPPAAAGVAEQSALRADEEEQSALRAGVLHRVAFGDRITTGRAARPLPAASVVGGGALMSRSSLILRAGKGKTVRESRTKSGGRTLRVRASRTRASCCRRRWKTGHSRRSKKCTIDDGRVINRHLVILRLGMAATLGARRGIIRPLTTAPKVD